MLKTIYLIVIVIVICLYEIPKLRKLQGKKDLVIFSVILSFATIVYFLEVNGVEVPNPLDGLRAIFSPIGLGIEKLFTS